MTAERDDLQGEYVLDAWSQVKAFVDFRSVSIPFPYSENS